MALYPDEKPAMQVSLTAIEPDLFLGNQNASWWLPVLKANGITAVVSLGNARLLLWTSQNYRKVIAEESHLFVPCLDSDTQDLLVHMEDICDFIDGQLTATESTAIPPPAADGGRAIPQTTTHNTIAYHPPKVLIHCGLGISRSPTVVIAYLMRKRRRSVDEVLQFVKEKRKIKPNANFMDQLRVWEQTRYQIWEDDERTVPKPAYQAYLNRRAVRLTERGLTGNEPTGPVSL
ncbi:hypothetical protein VTK73DRAFT_3471 [Phialemonium thermophilum]|uniref:protein-tyrosine-phosphatase n=1 Tax=Phialemonium thermophilum TaxID=223376 RepID=A0ABR3WYT7_9PEZI